MSAFNPITQLRQHKRELRRALTAAEQAQHASQLTRQILRHPRFLTCRHIACYLPNDGEIDPIYILGQSWSRGKQVYLPVLSPLKNSLQFAPFEPESIMCTNKFGIQEPACPPKYWVSAQQLDLVLLPLVAFDETGNRLGMGGGFYDRSLAHLRLRQHFRKPYLIGLAHELQKTERLSVENWDIPLDAIATEKQIYTTTCK